MADCGEVELLVVQPQKSRQVNASARILVVRMQKVSARPMRHLRDKYPSLMMDGLARQRHVHRL